MFVFAKVVNAGSVDDDHDHDHSQRQLADSGNDQLDMTLGVGNGGNVDDDCDVVLTDHCMMPDGMFMHVSVGVFNVHTQIVHAHVYLRDDGWDVKMHAPGWRPLVVSKPQSQSKQVRIFFLSPAPKR